MKKSTNNPTTKRIVAGTFVKPSRVGSSRLNVCKDARDQFFWKKNTLVVSS